MEGIIVAAIVGLAGLWAGARLFRRRSGADCRSGCGGCSCESKAQPLATMSSPKGRSG